MARRWCLVLAALLMAATLASCRWESEDTQRVVDGYEALVSVVGSFQITNDRELIGSRMRGTDAYTGSYTADCQDADGRDVIFGGASIRTRRLHLTGQVRTEAGTARLRIRLGEEAQYWEPDENGCFDIPLLLSGGGNYIMVDFEGFRGTVELTVTED